MTVAKTVPQLKEFVEQGGTVSDDRRLGEPRSSPRLPISDALVERTANGSERPLPQDKFYVPGSILQVAVDNTNPLAFGFEKEGRRVLRQQPGVPAGAGRGAEGREAGGVVRRTTSRCAPAGRGASTISKAAPPSPKRQVGKGKVFLFGPEITFRAQPHGTFKFLFNGIYYGPAVSGAAPTSSPTAAQ